MEKEIIISALENLSVRNGGSIINQKKLIEQDKRVVQVFIGLGGLGSQAVNEIKTVTEDSMTNNDCRFFVAIDSDRHTIRELRKDTFSLDEKNYGRLNANETIELFDGITPIHIEEHMHSWLDIDSFKHVVLDGTGAQATRALGRVLLLSNNTYYRVKNHLCEVLRAAWDRKNQYGSTGIHIHLIAGVSGGTGGGTIVDIAFMIRNIIEGMAQNPNSFILEGCIFTPDVQLCIPYINETQRAMLKRNFYASMKEIDYYYNNIERNNVYTSPRDDVPDVRCNIFDMCKLISNRSSSGDYIFDKPLDVVKNYAQAVKFEMLNVENINETSYSYYSKLHQIPNIIHTWHYTSVSADMAIPNWAPMKYSSYGYSSVNVPINEVMVCSAKKLIDKLYAQWNEQNIIEDDLKKILKSLHLSSARDFAKHLFTIVGCSDALEVDINALPHDPIGPGPVKNIDKYINELDAIIESTCSRISIKNYMTAARGMDDAVLKHEFTDIIFSIIDEAFYNPSKGPLYAINLMSFNSNVSDDAKCHSFGIIEHTMKLICSLSEEANIWNKELECMHKSLMIDAEQLKSFKIGQHDPAEITNFIIGYSDYAKQRLMLALLMNSNQYLCDIYDSLVNNKYYEMYHAYKTTLTHLKESLEENEKYVLCDSKLVSDPTMQKAMKFYSDMVDGLDLDTENVRFIKNVFGGLKSIINMHSNSIKPIDIEDVLINYFKEVFGQMTIDSVEKYCCIAGNKNDINLNQLATIWSNPNIKKLSMEDSSIQIIRALHQKTKIMLRSSVYGFVERLPMLETMLVPAATPCINNEIHNDKITLSAIQNEFAMYKIVCGFPLFMLDGLAEYKDIYDHCDFPGIHINEVAENWKENFPEPYSYAASRALAQYRAIDENICLSDKSKFDEILNLSLCAKKFGILKKTISEQDFSLRDNPYYILLCGVSDGMEDKNVAYEKIKNAYFKSETKDFLSVLLYAGYQINYEFKVKWGTVHPYFDIMENCTEFGNIDNIGNFVYMIYANSEWRKDLKYAVEIFEYYYDIYNKVINEQI